MVAISRTNSLFTKVNIANNTVIRNRVGAFWGGYSGAFSPWWTSLGSYYSTLYQPSLINAYADYAPYGFCGGYAYPVQPVAELRPGMSAYLDWRSWQ